MDTRSSPNDNVGRGTTFIVLAAVLTFFSITTTTIRIFMRSLKRQLGWDDIAITLATLLSVVELVFNGLEYRAGYGHHIFYLKPSQKVEIVKWNYVTEILLFLILCLTKISICLFILRIKNTGWLKRFLYGLIAGLVLTTLVCEVILFAQCQPLRAWWDRSAGTCWNLAIYNGSIWAQIGYSILSDLACSFLPVVVLWNIKIPLRLKIAVCGLMTIGLLATACAAVRASLARNKTSSDLTWTLTPVSDWGCAEEHMGIIGTNLALSHAAYCFFRDGPRAWNGKRRYQYQSSYIPKKPSMPTSKGRRGLLLSTRSQDSIIPLEDSVIKKTTDFSIRQETRNASSDRSAGLGLENKTPTAEDQV